MPLRKTSLLLSLAVLLFVPVAAGTTDPRGQEAFTGSFDATGRACAGGLYIRVKTLDWLTTWSQCKKLPYKVLEHSTDGNQQSLLLQLTGAPAKSCQFEVLYLHHGLQADPNINWEVIGYQSLAEFKADRESDFKSKPAHRLSCYLTRRE